MLLKPRGESHADSRKHGYFGRFFLWFNRWFGRTSDRYRNGVARALRIPMRWMAVFGVVVVLVITMFRLMPGGFLPEEDQGYVITVEIGRAHVCTPVINAQLVCRRLLEKEK